MGFVEHIHVASAAAAPPRSQAEARAIAGVGLAGDRYAAGKGYWSPDPKVSRDLTLIEAEVIEEVARKNDPALQSGETRRNVTTRGLGLGLFITREIVRAHGGAIEFASHGCETTFTVRLPILAGTV